MPSLFLISCNESINFKLNIVWATVVFLIQFFLFNKTCRWCQAISYTKRTEISLKTLNLAGFFETFVDIAKVCRKKHFSECRFQKNWIHNFFLIHFFLISFTRLTAEAMKYIFNSRLYLPKIHFRFDLDQRLSSTHVMVIKHSF